MDRKLLNKLKFHLTRLGTGGAEEDWAKVKDVLAALELEPATTSTAVLTKMLLSSSDALRQRCLPGDYARLMRELEHVLRNGGEVSQTASHDDPVQRAATLLRGRAIVIIGGDPRPEHQERLREALALSAVFWPPTHERRPDIHAFEPWIAREDVAVVVLLIRWIRHALGEVAGLCDRHGKPMARITGGYNVSQVASAVLEQCGKRLSS